MNDFPNRDEIINRMAIAMWETESATKPWVKLGGLIKSRKLQQAKSALNAMLSAIPVCEDPYSAAWCYEKLEEMR